MSNYVDKMANLAILGNLIKNPSLLEQEDKYPISSEDFPDKLYEAVFLSINNLFVNGMKKIDNEDIVLYIKSSLPKIYEKEFEKNGSGLELLNKAIQIGNKDKLDYYYNRMKKFTLLRTYNAFGMDVTSLYNPNTLDFALKQKQEQFLENCNIIEIADYFDDRIEQIKSKALLSGREKATKAGEGIVDLIEDLKLHPAIGAPLPFGIYNTIVNGARLKKVYLSSAATGKGKSRNMAASMCYLACSEIFNLKTKKWDKLTTKKPSLIITTELELEEVQTMLLSFISGVNESKILNVDQEQKITQLEQERVNRAAQIIKEAPLYVSYIPDFSLSDIENAIKSNIREFGIMYVALDYIHTSLRILEEITKKTNGVRLREDNILFMLAIKLKDIANQFGVFIMTGTQLNASGESGEQANAGMLRGARSIGDKMDCGEIMRGLHKDDLDALEIIKKSLKLEEEPNYIREIFKNRRSQYKQGVKLWCYADLGICRIEPLFLTDENNQIIPVPEFKITVE